MLKIINTEIIDNMKKGPIRRSLFSNGAVVLFHHCKGFSGAKINLNFLAGSMFESKDQFGLAHLIEHLIFKEVETNIVRDLELKGAEINAYTYKENVCFEMSCLAKKVTDLIPQFLDLFFTLDFTEEQLEKEKLIVIQELNEDKDDHETQGIEKIFNKNFCQDLGHPIGGVASRIKAYTREEVFHFYQKYFRPERMILTIVAGKELKKIEPLFQSQMEQRFKFKKSKPFRIKTVNKIKKLNHTKMSIKKKMESAFLFYSFDGPSVECSSYYDYIILDEVLFEGMSSLFFKKFREENAYVYGLGSSINSFGSMGNYIMMFNTQNENIKPIKKGIKEVLNQLMVNGVSNLEIDLIKERIIDAWEIAFDDIDERADYISDNEIYQLHHLDITSLKKTVRAVNLKSITKLLTKIYKQSECTELVILKS